MPEKDTTFLMWVIGIIATPFILINAFIVNTLWNLPKNYVPIKAFDDRVDELKNSMENKIEGVHKDVKEVKATVKILDDRLYEALHRDLNAARREKED